MEIRDWLSHSTAADVMVRSVVTLGPSDSLSTAANLLLKEQITGIPVVRDDGVCVGVLSAIDIVHAEDQNIKERKKIAESSIWHSSPALPLSIYEQKLTQVRDKVGPLTVQRVEQFMTKNLVAVQEQDFLLTVVQYMVNAHVHRIIVLRGEKHLAGIITTTDVMAAMLRQVDEVRIYGD